MWRRSSGLYPIESGVLDGAPAGGGGVTAAELEAAVTRLLDKKGDKAAVGELLTDNFKQREEIRTLKDTLEKAPKVAEGGLILKPEEAKMWAAYQALGKPEEIKTSLDSKVELEKKVKDGERKEAIAAAAEAAGFKASVLQDLKGADTLKFEVKEETVDGQKVKVAYVTAAAQGSTPQKLTDYAQTTWPDFILSLEADEDGKPASRTPTGTPFVRQQSDGKPPKKTISVEEVAETKRGSRDYAL